MNEELKIFIRAEIADLRKHLDEAQKKVKETASQGESGFKKFGEAAKSAGKVIGTGLKVAGAAIAAAGAALIGLSEGTMDYRKNQAQLTAAFEQAKLGAASASETYKQLYGVIGDDDQAVESAANIAMLASNSQEAAQWAGLASGVLGTFHDTLQPEAFYEAANETLKLGEATGAFAQMLEQTGVMSVEDFNAELAQCTTEAEKQALMLDVSRRAMGEAGAAYEASAADIIASNEAQAKLNDTLANLGAIATPIISTLKLLLADLLVALTPFIELIGTGLQGALQGTEGATEQFAAGISGLLSTALEKIVEVAPTVIDTVLELIPTLLTALLGQLPNILQTILTIIGKVVSELGGMLKELIPVVIDAVIMCAEVLIDNIDMIIDAGIELILGLADGLIIALPRLIAKIPVIIGKLVGALFENGPKLAAMGVELIVKLGAGLIKAIPQIRALIPQIITAVVEALKKGVSKVKDIGKDIIEGLWNGIKDMAGWIKDKISGFGKGVLDNLKSFFGIHSPSRVMEDQVGRYLAEGIGVGFMDEIDGVNKEIEKSMTPLTAARSFTVHGAFDSLTPISAGGGNVAPINSKNQWLDKLTSSMQADSRPIILKVGEKVLAETTFKAWNSYVAQTGDLPVKVW